MKDHLIKALDPVFFVIFALAALFSVLLLKKDSQGKSRLYITSPSGEYIYPLDKDATYEIEGSEGISVILVENGEASFIQSPCPNKTCISQGSISRNGQWIACLPNGVFIKIENPEDGLDAVSQ